MISTPESIPSHAFHAYFHFSQKAKLSKCFFTRAKRVFTRARRRGKKIDTCRA